MSTSGDHGHGSVVQEHQHISLRELLAAYDDQVEASLAEAFGSTSGTERVKVLHNRLARSVAVHDAVLESALCPLLEDLPGGPEVAARLRTGCEGRAALLQRFDALSHGVAAQNVYPAAAEQVEEILEGLEQSFDAHADDETVRVADVLEKASTSADPEVVAARMAFEAHRAPTRSHRSTVAHPESKVRRAILRSTDRFADWVDSHHGWSDARPLSPRQVEVQELLNQSVASPSIRNVLVGYDTTIDTMVDALEAARTPAQKAEAARRLSAAIVIHDSVVGGVLCPLLSSVPEAKAMAERLAEECATRAELQKAWTALTKEASLMELYDRRRPEVDAVMGPIVESFRSHEREETLEIAPLLEKVPASAYRTKVSPLEDVMWPWHSEGPALLALHMAGWAESAPTRTHPVLLRHPSSRVLRTMYQLVDHFRDYWKDSGAARWLFPKTPERPLSSGGSVADQQVDEADPHSSGDKRAEG